MWHFVTWLLHLFYVMWFYICSQLDNDDVRTMLNNISCYCCCVDFRISTYRELSPGGLWTLMSTDRAGQIWPLLFVRPLSPTPQSIQNNRPHSSNFVILLLGNWWKLLCFKAKKRIVNCILQKNKWRIWFEQTSFTSPIMWHRFWSWSHLQSSCASDWPARIFINDKYEVRPKCEDWL